MKTMAALVLGTCALLATADDKRGDPEGMSCRDVVIVRYVDGPNADEFSTHVADHLEFLRKGLQSGDILFAARRTGRLHCLRNDGQEESREARAAGPLNCKKGLHLRNEYVDDV